MKKIGILTFYKSNFNYGGLLQAYALQKTIENLGYDCYQISYKAKDFKYSIKNIEKTDILRVFRKIQKFISNVKFNKKNNALVTSQKIREKYFLEFMEQIKHTKTYDNSNIKQCLKNINIFIVGSDQVWSPFRYDENFFLKFVPDDCSKISYAASIGKNKLTKKQAKFMIPLCDRFNYISVRENEAVTLLEKRLSQNIKVVLDPTFLLTKDEWTKIEKTVKIRNSYIFVYLLGNNKKHREMIKKFSEILCLKIVFLPHIHFKYEPADKDFADVDLYNV